MANYYKSRFGLALDPAKVIITRILRRTTIGYERADRTR